MNERRPAAAASRQKLDATRQRSRNRVRVKLEFTLPEARRLFLILRGPAPSCRIAGVIPFRGRKGHNAATFAGRVRGRLLEPGVYLLTISPTRRLTPNAPTEYVRVASARRTVPLAEGARKPTCTVAQALAADPTARFLANERQLAVPSAMQARPARSTAQPTARPTAPLRPPLSPAVPDLGRDEIDDGLFDALPRPAEIGSAPGEGIATIVVILIAGLLLLTMLWLVARFMRGTWNP